MLVDHVCCSEGYEGCCASFVGAMWPAGNGAGALPYTTPCVGTGCRRAITVRRSWPETGAEQRQAGVCVQICHAVFMGCFFRLDSTRGAGWHWAMRALLCLCDSSV